MVQLFLVNPKLELLDCNSCPSQDALQCSEQAHQTALERYQKVADLERANSSAPRKATHTEVEYFKTIADYTAAEYYYLKCYREINAIAEKHFSKPELTIEDENKGMALLNEQLEKFKQYEKDLKKLKMNKERLSRRLKLSQ
ncbi:unnamed protein product [Kuraishia capsulata CBS 1993]|uniref:Uncharacterized protein n=1 Tax=Kuraishia capsulata CBS 1993 TaxID=1382522 RepID=W6MGS3_9ASCO|nr:uncharacterized protein KUCA_T00000759001 [Kuraishia capsulata CBS 1993]CDK24793.1 unnamed protein product [Kuraishia capsulata CBS 1993]